MKKMIQCDNCYQFYEPKQESMFINAFKDQTCTESTKVIIDIERHICEYCGFDNMREEIKE